LVKDHRIEIAAGGIVHVRRRRGRSRRICYRRDAHQLAGNKPGRGFDPFAIHAHLASAKEFLDRALGQGGKMAAKPAVQPYIGLVLRYFTMADGHGADLVNQHQETKVFLLLFLQKKKSLLFS
jgi:hypothetical protein